MWIHLLSLELIDGAGGTVVPPAVVPSTTPAGGGNAMFRRRKPSLRRYDPEFQRTSLAEVVDLAVQEVVAELRREGDGQVQEQVAAIVAPHVVKPKPRSRPRVDYDALEADVAAVRKLVALLREQRQQEIDEDEEEAMIYAAL